MNVEKALLTLNRMKSPVVTVPLVAVSQLPVVKVELAVITWLVESMVNTLLPEPFCTARAVVLEIFMRSPPVAVKPERKVPDEFCSSIRLDDCAGAVLIARLAPT